MTEANEKCIAKLIYNKIPIEWIRYNMYIEVDRYRNIPMLVFRVKETCSENMIMRLKNSVDEFEGKLKWKVFVNPLSRNGNFLLTISEMEKFYNKCYLRETEYDQKQYFGIEKYKEYCDWAIQDIPMLEEHIAKTL